jgi:predicted P-loop ATPase/GTPase
VNRILNPELLSVARRKAILTRHRPADDPELIEVSRTHAVLAIENYVARVLAAAPRLRPEQVDRLRHVFPETDA